MDIRMRYSESWCINFCRQLSFYEFEGYVKQYRLIIMYGGNDREFWLHPTFFFAQLCYLEICGNLVAVLLYQNVSDREPLLSPITCPLHPMVHKHQNQPWGSMGWVANSTSVESSQLVEIVKGWYDSSPEGVPVGAGSYWILGCWLDYWRHENF